MDDLVVIDANAPADVFREAWKREGVLVVKGMFNADIISRTRADILRILYNSGWITNADDDHPLANLKLRCAHPDLAYLRTYRRALKIPGLYELPHCGNVDAVAGKLGMDELFRLPRVTLRIVFPGSNPTPAHQDWATVQGYRGAATVWVPLVSCPLAMGPVTAIPGSHHQGLWQRTSAGSLREEVVITGGGDRWVAAEIGVGDAVLFQSLTVHRAMPNVSQIMRLSIDFRMQPLDEVLHPGSLLPPEGFRTWDAVYASWTGVERQFVRYWRERHPPIEPTAGDLRRSLAQAKKHEIPEINGMLAQVEELTTNKVQ